jgi:hypothetical protein
MISEHPRLFLGVISFIVGSLFAFGMFRLAGWFRLEDSFQTILVLSFGLICGLMSFSYLSLSKRISSVDFTCDRIRAQIELLEKKEVGSREKYDGKTDRLAQELARVRRIVGEPVMPSSVKDERMVSTRSDLRHVIGTIRKNAPEYLRILNCYDELTKAEGKEFIELNRLLDDFSLKTQVSREKADELFRELRRNLPQFITVQTDRRDNAYVRIRL